MSKYFMESADKIRYFFEKEAVGPDGKLKVDQSVSLNKVLQSSMRGLNPVFHYFVFEALTFGILPIC